LAIERLSDLHDRLREFARERDWNQFHNPKNLACSVSIEAGELLELFQWSNVASENLDSAFRQRAGEELADVLFYVVMLADRLDIDLAAAAEAKLAKNAEKYPVDASYGNAARPRE